MHRSVLRGAVRAVQGQSAEIGKNASLRHERMDGIYGVGRIILGKRIDDRIHATLRKPIGEVDSAADFHARPLRQGVANLPAHVLVGIGILVLARRHVYGPPRFRLGPRSLQSREQQIHARKRLMVRGPAHLCDPDGLGGVAILRHHGAKLLYLRIHHPFRTFRARVRMDAQDVETLPAAKLVHLLDERNRHARSAAERHADRRIRFFHRLVRPAQESQIVGRIGVFPEVEDVLFIPDLKNRKPPAIAFNHPANILFPCIEVLMNRSRPLHRVAEDRQELNALGLAFGKNSVEAIEVPHAFLRFELMPVEVAAHPPHADLAHHVARPGGRKLGAGDMRARAIWIVGTRKHKRCGKSTGNDGDSHRAASSSTVHFSRCTSKRYGLSGRAVLLKSPKPLCLRSRFRNTASCGTRGARRRSSPS